MFRFLPTLVHCISVEFSIRQLHDIRLLRMRIRMKMWMSNICGWCADAETNIRPITNTYAIVCSHDILIDHKREFAEKMKHLYKKTFCSKNIYNLII